MLGEQFHLGTLLLLFVLLVDREYIEWNVETFSDTLEIRMVADDQRNLDVPFAGDVAGEQIVEAVRHF